MAILQKVARWASIVRESRVVSIILCWWLQEPSSLLSFSCLAVAEIAVPWLVSKIKPIQCIAIPVLLVRLIYIIKGFGAQIHFLG